MVYLKAVNLGLKVKTGKRVVVVGGGNAALDAARTAVRQGAKSVVVAYRRSREDMPAWTAETEAAEEEGIKIITQVQPVRIQPSTLVCLSTRPGEPDESGRPIPEVVPDQEISLEADQIIVATGQVMNPDWSSSSDLVPDRTAQGLIDVNPETCQSSHPRIFAGGGMTPCNRTVTEAMAAGARAAWGIDGVLRGKRVADRRPPPPRPQPVESAWSIGLEVGQTCRHQVPEELDPSGRAQGSQEVVNTLTEQQALLEASRCLACGLCGNCRSCLELFGCPPFYVKGDRIFIDNELCMGCGVCAKICPNGAIQEMTGDKIDGLVKSPNTVFLAKVGIS